jgi:DNA-binding NtrC family response regulator
MDTTVDQPQPIHVLVVEDEALLCEFIAESLAEQGFTVRAAGNATDALSHLASARVDILFTDIDLPGGVNGTALARRARELAPNLPVVYASGRTNMVDMAMRVPGSIFVAKPYDPQVVGQLLARTLNAPAARITA